MLWSVIRLIFKTSSVTPDFFYVFNLILSFSTCSQSFKKICAWELLGVNVLKQYRVLIPLGVSKTQGRGWGWGRGELNFPLCFFPLVAITCEF